MDKTNKNELTTRDISIIVDIYGKLSWSMPNWTEEKACELILKNINRLDAFQNEIYE